MDVDTLSNLAVFTFKHILEDDNRWLMRDSVDDDILQAVRQFKPLKTSRLDGMRTIF